jgi:hypothetical protein
MTKAEEDSSHDRLYKDTQGRSIAILTAYKNSASDEENIKANSHLYIKLRKTGYGVIKIEKSADVRRANELFSSENHVNVSNSPYILEGIAQLVVGPQATLPTELDDDGNPVDSFVKKIVTPEKAERKILSNIKGFRSDMIYHGKMFEQDSIIFKPLTDENAYLIGTSDSDDGKNKQLFDLGKWHPSKFGEMFYKLKNGHSSEQTSEEEEYEFLKGNSFFSRGNSSY